MITQLIFFKADLMIFEDWSCQGALGEPCPLVEIFHFGGVFRGVLSSHGAEGLHSKADSGSRFLIDERFLGDHRMVCREGAQVGATLQETRQ